MARAPARLSRDAQRSGQTIPDQFDPGHAEQDVGQRKEKPFGHYAMRLDPEPGAQHRERRQHQIGNPGLQGEHDFTMLHEALEDEDIVVEKHKQVRVIKTKDSHGVTIISGDELDDDTRAKLEKVLEEAGKDGEILFLDGSELGGDEQVHAKHEVRVIKKKTDVTN